jgi:hypothetical protein
VWILDQLQHYGRRTSDTLIQDGVAPLLWRTLIKCASPFGRLGIVNLYEKDLTGPVEPVRPRVQLAVNQASLDDLEALTALRMLDETRPESMRRAHIEQQLRLQSIQRFGRGWKCYVARAEGRIVHCTWVAVKWAESIGHRYIALKEDEAYTADAYTAKAWRSKGLHRLVKFQILQDLKKANYQTAYVLVHVDCRPSKWVQVLLGYKTLGTVLYFASRRSHKTWVLLLRGSAGPFLEQNIPLPWRQPAEIADFSW